MKLTVNDRVGLFLYEFRHIEDDYEVPEAVTQSGIAAGVGISVTHVPRAVNRLEEQGLVFSKSTYVKGGTRKKKTYHLNRDGVLKYRDLRESLGKLKINDGSGDTTIKELFDALCAESRERCLPAPMFFQIILGAGEEDVFDKQAYLGELESGLPEQLSTVMPFVGRNAEVEALKKMLGTTFVAVIVGEEGSGRTALVRNALSGGSVMFCPELSDRPAVQRTLDGSEGAVVVLDKNLVETDEQLFEDLKWLVIEKGVGVVLTASSERVYASLKRNLEGLVIHKVDLGPLDRESIKKLAGSELDDKELDSLIHLTKGNPKKLLAALEVELDDLDGEGNILEDHQKALLRLLKSSE